MGCRASETVAAAGTCNEYHLSCFLVSRPRGNEGRPFVVVYDGAVERGLFLAVDRYLAAPPLVHSSPSCASSRRVFGLGRATSVPGSRRIRYLPTPQLNR